MASPQKAPAHQAGAPRQNMSRSKLIQLIHVAKKQLAMDDENYRNLISQVKKSAISCTDLNLFQLGQLYNLLKDAGFKVTKKIPNRTPKKRKLQDLVVWATQAQLYCIRGLWELASSNKDEATLNKMCYRITGIHTIQWLDKENATKLILALRDITAKQGYNPDSIPKHG